MYTGKIVEWGSFVVIIILDNNEKLVGRFYLTEQNYHIKYKFASKNIRIL